MVIGKQGSGKKHSLEYRVICCGFRNMESWEYTLFLEHMVLGIETENLWFWRYTVLII